jgi:hypothetical protein
VGDHSRCRDQGAFATTYARSPAKKETSTRNRGVDRSQLHEVLGAIA